MTAKNDITGDPLKTKPASDAYRDNYDRVFGRKEIPVRSVPMGRLAGGLHEALQPLTPTPKNKKEGL